MDRLWKPVPAVVSITPNLLEGRRPANEFFCISKEGHRALPAALVAGNIDNREYPYQKVVVRERRLRF